MKHTIINDIVQVLNSKEVRVRNYQIFYEYHSVSQSYVLFHFATLMIHFFFRGSFAVLSAIRLVTPPCLVTVTPHLFLL